MNTFFLLFYMFSFFFGSPLLPCYLISSFLVHYSLIHLALFFLVWYFSISNRFGNGYWNFDEIIAIIIYLLAASLKSISVISGGPLSFIIVKLFCIQLHREEFIELHFRLVWITLNVEQRKKKSKRNCTK